MNKSDALVYDEKETKKYRSNEFFVPEKKEIKAIADNIVAFMKDDVPLTRESALFIYNWVITGKDEKVKVYFDIWDIVLKKYLPEERPVLFRSCNRIRKRDIVSFTGRIEAAARFSDDYKGQVLVCDTKEYLWREDETAKEHKLSFFPLSQCIKKGACSNPSYFGKRFYEDYKGEDEYILRADYDNLYHLKWNKKYYDSNR